MPKMTKINILLVIYQLMLQVMCSSLHNEKVLSDDSFTNKMRLKIGLLLEI